MELLIKVIISYQSNEFPIQVMNFLKIIESLATNGFLWVLDKTPPAPGRYVILAQKFVLLETMECKVNYVLEL